MSKTIIAQLAKEADPAALSHSDFDFAFALDERRAYEVTSQPLPYGFLFSPKGRGLPLVVICPYGADRSRDGQRSFLRADWAAKLPYNVLIWQDPTAALDEAVQSGFGLGTADHWVLPNIARVVRRLRDQLAIANENIVFVGYAGGAFASLVLASQLPGSCCLLNNPNTDLVKERRTALGKVLSHGYPGLTLADVAQAYPERFIAGEALKKSPIPPRIYCLQHAQRDVRHLKSFLSFALNAKLRGTGATGREEEDMVVEYYVDDQPGDKPAKVELWSRRLESMSRWFATRNMAKPVLRTGAQAGAPVERTGPRQSWSELLPTEIAYWDVVISGKHRKPETVKAFRERAAGHYPVPGPIVKLLQRLDILRAKILDVGSGPHTTIGPVLYGTRLNITAVDPLANAYNDLLDQYGIEPAIRTLPGEGERLVEQFGTDRFDIVHSRNALDHSRDPWLALQQMIDVCVPGGVVYIEGSINEGLKQRYAGLHQWNFMPVDRDLVIWNDEGSNIASKALSGVAQIRTSGKDSWFTATLLKDL
ncbi:class I SAM-dependent methyltransferase [Ancylobacter oerskovii]|uniref:Class I SAM-dependent methyltransferase n=1 Tax=Ancylobacter oerskovii TaxID=459519 RepID=A0ABW4YVM2_9HYPH|nr:methyltransferase domain-containing protein [Ancylobacter oerskovii]MBS7544293.1 methyltransferase domain-containing protein [Ancylobacter oerskovii]